MPEVQAPERTCAAPLEHPSKPTVELPDGSCDSHCHVFGPYDVFPFAPERTFTPPDAPKERLRGLHDFLGFSRAVIVQSACHGFDHAAMLDAVASDRSRYRGVALVRAGTSAETIAALSDAGVCGARFHFLAHVGAPPPWEEIRETAKGLVPFGWHVELHVSGPDLANYASEIAAIDAPVVIDHLGRVDLAEGLAGPSVEALVALLDRGNVWVKLSGPERIARRPAPYEDAVALAAMLAAHAPRRVLWGSDFPHPNITGAMPDDGVLVDLIGAIAPTPSARRLLLVDNPAELFGFA